jgi:hypothetical protein
MSRAVASGRLLGLAIAAARRKQRPNVYAPAAQRPAIALIIRSRACWSAAGALSCLRRLQHLDYFETARGHHVSSWPNYEVLLRDVKVRIGGVQRTRFAQSELFEP